ncbi:MAG TPA: hypothetical protein VKF41_02290 [Bryobacteraceae bacterium]|nr:hypothetical protein [Bryobacteraceae bacterium]
MLTRTTLMVAGLLVLAVAASAQNPGPGRGRGRFGPPAADAAAPGGARFLGAEAGMPGRVVKNAPYSADIVTETTQTLADGNHIRQSSTVKVYRDSQGRTRHEQSLNALGGLAASSNLPQVVFINDPVAGVNYALNPQSRTATKSAWVRPGRGGQAQGPNQPMARLRQQSADGSAAIAGRRGRGAAGATGTPTPQSLGRQTIEGVPADGTRTTVTIAAGQWGNEQPIQIVTERWYSPDLQMFVLSKRTDPRMGETVSRVTNIGRSEPPNSLFEPPADYKVSEAGGRPGRPAGAPAQR